METVNFLSDIKQLFENDIPQHVYEKSKFSLLDYIAVTVAGAKANSKKVDNYLKIAQPEKGLSTAIGLNTKTNLKEAVFLNGLNSHTLDLDDGCNHGIIHLGAPIFSVLLPLAEKYKINTNVFLKAAIMGYEAAYTMAISIQPKHKQLGYHATGTCGILGIAIAVSQMLNFTDDERKNAFACAALSASGMLKAIDEGSELKPYNVAKTALLGLISAQLAKAGFRGPTNPLDGERGFLKMMADDENIKIKNVFYDGSYAIEKTYTKPHAACRYCHPAIEAALALRNKKQIKIDTIKSITVRTYSLAVNKHDHTEINSTASAKMSIPYSVASALLYGKVGLNEFNEKQLHNKELLNLTKKVKVVADQHFSNAFPEITAASVEIRDKNDNLYTEKVDIPKGEPENPLSQSDFFDRFYDLTSYAGKDKNDAKMIIDTIMNMNGSMERLFAYL